MANDLVKTTEVDVLTELQHTEKVVAGLMSSKHYAKMGHDGIYAIVQKAKSLGISPMDALNGGAYYVQGKVELHSQMMNSLIRAKGHSIQKDDASTSTNCILIGKRADNGDKWTVSFSVDDAKRAGIYKPHGPWEKYTEAMCFARALSMLARQLFPDVIVDTYVSGEISDAPQTISDDQVLNLQNKINQDDSSDKLKKIILDRFQINLLDEIPSDRYEAMISWIEKRQAKQKVDKQEVLKPVYVPQITPEEMEEMESE
jgi:hypothetical protein